MSEQQIKENDIKNEENLEQNKNEKEINNDNNNENNKIPQGKILFI
jgi:hypothetical protein